MRGSPKCPCHLWVSSTGAGGPPILEFLGQPITRTTGGGGGGSAAPVGDYQMRAVIRPPQQYVPYSSYQPRGGGGGRSDLLLPQALMVSPLGG